MVDFSVPSIDQASLIDKEIRLSLTESLISLKSNQLFPSLTPPLLNSWTARPVDFGWYYDLLVFLNTDPKPTDAESYSLVIKSLNDSFNSQASTVGSSNQKKHSLKITTLGEPWFNSAEVDCIVRWLDIEADNEMGLMALNTSELAHASENLHRAITVIEALLPDFMQEMLAITSEIIFAKPSGRQKMTFGGASSFSLWGALALNFEAHPDWWQYIPRLIHEYSHNLLFGIARNEPLVFNDPEERYESPLRQDLRPMDGIYHALFVSAREALAMRAILSHPDEKKIRFGFEELDAYCKLTLEDSAQTFNDCLLVIKKHGRLTKLGSAVLIDNVNAMKELNLWRN